MIVLKKNSNNFAIKVKRALIPIEETLIPYLTEEIEIEKGVTFEDFFNIIMKHHDIYSEIFRSHLGGYSLDIFLPEWQLQSTKTLKGKHGENDDECHMSKIVIAWQNIYIIEDKELIESGLDIELIPEFTGIGISKEGDEVGFGLEFTPLNELKKYPIELKPDAMVKNLTTQKDSFKLNRILTVYDVLSAIFYEITYCGSPEMRNASLEDLKNRIHDIDEQFDEDGHFIGDKNGYKTMDEVMSTLKNKIDDVDDESTPEEFDEYGHRKIKSNNTNLDEILKKLHIDKPKDEE